MNVKLLEKIKKHILAEPKRLFMGAWIVEQEEKTQSLPKRTIGGERIGDRKFAPCGTAGCIAGWAVMLSNKNWSNSEYAAQLLGIDIDSRHRLFDVSSWPSRFRFYAENGSKKSAKIAAARIEHFIKTKGAE